MAAELNREKSEWEEPAKAMTYNSDNEVKGSFGVLLRDDYYSGNIGFHRLGLKSFDPTEFSHVQTKNFRTEDLIWLLQLVW